MCSEGASPASNGSPKLITPAVSPMRLVPMWTGGIVRNNDEGRVGRIIETGAIRAQNRNTYNSTLSYFSYDQGNE
jgi:hypothetical protein